VKFLIYKHIKKQRIFHGAAGIWQAKGSKRKRKGDRHHLSLDPGQATLTSAVEDANIPHDSTVPFIVTLSSRKNSKSRATMDISFREISV